MAGAGAGAININLAAATTRALLIKVKFKVKAKPGNRKATAAAAVAVEVVAAAINTNPAADTIKAPDHPVEAGGVEVADKRAASRKAEVEAEVEVTWIITAITITTTAIHMMTMITDLTIGLPLEVGEKRLRRRVDDLAVGAEMAVEGENSREGVGEGVGEDLGVDRKHQEGMKEVWEVWEVEGAVTIIMIIGCSVEVVEEAWEWGQTGRLGEEGIGRSVAAGPWAGTVDMAGMGDTEARGDRRA